MTVVEAHNIPGGAAHHWEREGYQFDSGAALFSGLRTPAKDGITANPVSSVLAALGETVDAVDLPDSATCLVYPDGQQYRTQLGSAQFQNVVAQRHGPQVAAEWAAFQAQVQRLFASAGSVEPMAVRLDNGAHTAPACCERLSECSKFAVPQHAMAGTMHPQLLGAHFLCDAFIVHY